MQYKWFKWFAEVNMRHFLARQCSHLKGFMVFAREGTDGEPVLTRDHEVV